MNKIKRLIKEHFVDTVQRSYSKFVKQEIYNTRHDLNKSVAELAYLIYFDAEPTICKVCNNVTKFISFSKGYREFCSMKCSNSRKPIKDKNKCLFCKKQTTGEFCSGMCRASGNLQNVSMDKQEIKKQISNIIPLTSYKKAILNKYSPPEIQNQAYNIKQFWLLNDIEEYPLCKAEGCYNIACFYHNNYIDFCSNSCAQKSANTLDKKRSTSLKKYGVIHHMKNSNIASKVSTSRKKSTIIQKPEYALLNDKQQLISIITGRNIMNVAREQNINVSTLKEATRKMNIYHLFAKKSSYLEEDMAIFLSEHNIEYIKNDRKLIYPLEIDFYIPEHGLGIEMDGLVMHSEILGKKDKKYHIGKTIACRDNKVELIHVFEDEWVEHPGTVKSIILTKCQIAKTKLYARKLQIDKTHSKDIRDFCRRHHLQNSTNTKHNYSLTANGRIVAAMTFFEHASGEYELSRYCVHSAYMIIGGAERMFQRFLIDHKPKKIFTYSDNRYFSGNLYRKLGFEFKWDTGPNYWYNVEKGRKHRLGFTKDVLVKQGHPADLTEWEIMQETGYDRIWDCGNKRWEWINV